LIGQPGSFRSSRSGKSQGFTKIGGALVALSGNFDTRCVGIEFSNRCGHPSVTLRAVRGEVCLCQIQTLGESIEHFVDVVFADDQRWTKGDTVSG